MGAVVGGLCAFPIRLGGASRSGWAAEQHARLCADVVAEGRTAPFARVLVTFVADESATATAYVGMNGIGIAHAPTVTWSSDIATLTWPESWEDELGRIHPTNIRAVTTGASSGVPGAVVTAHNEIQCLVELVFGGTPSAVSADVAITVYGSPLETASLSDYGASKDKQNCRTEAIPYAEGWYRHFQSARGSAYSQERTGLVHAENLALARHFAWQTRLAEQYATNQNPVTAGVSMPEWIAILSLDPTASDEQNRAAAAAKQRLRLGNTPQVIDEIVSIQLGDRWVRNWRTPGTLTSPPDNTYGPAWETGPVSWDMGGGTWSSTRAKLTVEVQAPSDSDLGEFTIAVGQLMRLLDDALPAYMTFSWATGLSDPDDDDPDAVLGFRLDLDRMDYVGLS
jgi:hypothetical protein